tara:strand:+ start:538 stop:654 length:117 start_codon:yes stop_codon:yes gene_type:complete
MMTYEEVMMIVFGVLAAVTAGTTWYIKQNWEDKGSSGW